MVKNTAISMTRLIFIIIFVFFSRPLVTVAQEHKFNSEEYKIGIDCEDIHKFSWVTPKLNIKKISHAKTIRVQLKAAFELRSLQKSIYEKKILKIECGGIAVNAPLSERIIKAILRAGYKESFILNPDEKIRTAGSSLTIYLKDERQYTIYFDQDIIKIIYGEKANCSNMSDSINYEFDYSFEADNEFIREISNLCGYSSAFLFKED